MLSEKMQREALTKCIVWFYDGNVRTFYSLDKTHKRAKPNQALGIRRLEKMLMETFKGQWETAIIYENKSYGNELARFKRGARV
ncbi:hypothetical protein SAMN04488057_104319 [Cyclobacterium lianum]|uniref:Uncharacterized protein n=1 Tax=Cyclobacterium lianum TaxID=388280 RepID=A0A1M7MJT4_9BACT|nr:hypothetical protein [Cyclobacterium lianum]SHM90712.1 hypothetical protein SAMN04488057_104319 [Cyclobacterium lianum]